MNIASLQNYIFKKIDRPLFGSLTLILIISLINLTSANQQDMTNTMSQIINIFIGVAFLYFICNIQTRTILTFAPWVYLITIILLFVVDFFGIKSHGAQRWISLGIINFQPSEILKISLPLILAWFYQKNTNKIDYKIHFLAGLLILIPFYLILTQPDLGTSILLLSGGLIIIFLAGLPTKFLITSFFGILLSSPFLWNSLLDYQKQRILSLLDPFSDPYGAGYHSIQSMIALGSGGIYGRGWLNGTQTSLDFLPETRTDFIFSVFSEEFGFLGVLAILGLYIFIFYRCMWMTSKMQDNFSRLLSAGLTISLFTGFIVNVAMISGLFPIVGVPLPFFSYGGTSMVVSLISIGIIMNLYSNKTLIAN
jgi:rod shape determining protein RodA